MAERPGPVGSLTLTPMTLLVIEAVERVASPDARDSVLHLALADGGVSTVPEDPEAFRRFVLGPLKRAMELALGLDLAHAVLSDLSPLVERAATTTTSGVRTRARGVRDLLVVVTGDAGCADSLGQVAPDSVKLEVVGDLFELLRVVEGLGQGRAAIVVDCELPSARPAGLATLARILPPSVEVVLWGWDRIGDADLDVVELPAAWSRLPAGLGPLEVLGYAFPEPVPQPVTEPPPSIDAIDLTAPVQVALVVHENAMSRAALSSALARAGYEVVSAPDAYLALELVKSRAPSLVIADEALPRVDGAKLLRLARRVSGAVAPFSVLLAPEPLPFRDPVIDLVLDERLGAESIIDAIQWRRR